MRIMTIADALSSSSIGGTPLLPVAGVLQLRFGKADVLFVESAWYGWHNVWRYRVAKPKRDEPYKSPIKRWLRHIRWLEQTVESARKRRIPTVFWDKEGITHWGRFIDAARLFDHVFTVDDSTIPLYRDALGPNASVHSLPFAVQPRFHFFDGFHFEKNSACFVGSYSRHIHPQRRQWQEMFFSAALKSGFGLTCFDRNSFNSREVLRYPNIEGIKVRPAVPYKETAHIYKKWLVSLNVNTNEVSKTMVSRRLVEILACGGIAVTNSNPAVESEFSEFCHIIRKNEDAYELFDRIKYGPSKNDLERARAGADYIALHHTWDHRMRFIADIVGISYARTKS